MKEAVAAIQELRVRYRQVGVDAKTRKYNLDLLRTLHLRLTWRRGVERNPVPRQGCAEVAALLRGRVLNPDSPWLAEASRDAVAEPDGPELHLGHRARVRAKGRLARAAIDERRGGRGEDARATVGLARGGALAHAPMFARTQSFRAGL